MPASRVPSATHFALLAVLGLLLFAAMAVSSTPRTVEAALYIGPGSCLDMAADCSNLGPYTIIGANSCNSGGLGGACTDLNGRVGNNSCNGQQACEEAGFNGDYVWIGDRSCTRQWACQEIGDDGGSARVGNDSCNGADDDDWACQEIGEDGGEARVGSRSCNGDNSCQQVGGDGGTGRVGSDSCNGNDACQNGGQSAPHTGFAQVGDASCNGDQACQHVGEGFTAPGRGGVGNNSCNAVQACENIGEGGDGEVGNGSCNGVSACQDNGLFGTTGSIGSYSCNNDDQSPPCHTNAGVIGDCMHNDVDPPVCVLPGPLPGWLIWLLGMFGA
jgi:hypothetical protein